MALDFLQKYKKKQMPKKANLPKVTTNKSLIQRVNNKVQIGRIAHERWQFCYDCVSLARQRNISQEKACLAVAMNNERFPLLSKAGKGGKSALTYNNLRAWLRLLGRINLKNGTKDYNWDNVACLDNKYTTGKQLPKFDGVIFKFFCSLYLNNRQLPASICYKKTREFFKDVEEFPTIAQIKYQLKRLPKNVIDAGRFGIDYVENRSTYMLIRDWDKVRPNQCWFADSRTSDFYIRVPDGNKFKAVRPIVTFIMDAYSWHCVGFDVSADGTGGGSDLIRNTFAKACFEHGRPEIFYVDNGKDYNKKGFTTPVIINDKEYSILNELGVKLVNSKPYKGRSKTVERRFREFSNDFDRCQPSYCGNSPANRPEQADLYTKGDNIMLLMSEQQFVDKFTAEIEKFHNSKLGGHLKGKTPAEAFNSNNRLVRSPMSNSEMTRACLLTENMPRTVHRGGCIDFNRVRYHAEDLIAYTGNKVIIKSSYLEQGSIHAFNLAGNYIAECTAQCTVHPLANHLGTDEDKKQLDIELVKQGRQRKELLSGLKDVTGGLIGLSADELMSLTPEKLLNGKCNIKQLDSVHKVKGNTHNVKLVTTAEIANNLPKNQINPKTRKQLKRTEFDKDFDNLLSNKKEAENKNNTDFNLNDFSL